jgi:hypothetical protein
MTRTTCLAVFAALLLAGPSRAASKTYTLTVAAGDTDRTNTPIMVVLPLPINLSKAESVILTNADGKQLPAQLTTPGLFTPTPATDDNVPKELHFILPNLKAGQTATFQAVVSTDAPAKPAEKFSWTDKPGESAELSWGQQPVLRYMCLPYDDSSKEKRDLSYKPFHHLFDPDGKQLITQGTGGKVYPHHRGIYYGFMSVSHGDGKKADTWHCPGNVHQSHEKILASEAGPVLGRQRVAIDWHGADKKPFATEERELTVYRVPGGVLVGFASRLSSKGGKIKLDGDPQHAGFQFRAASEVAEKSAGKTYYLRPDGMDKPGATRNWDKGKPDFHANLPWNAMSFVVGDQRYTIAYLDRPTNPKPARFSERDYGRFGSYFVHEFDENKPCDVAYRLWLQKGEMKGPEVAALDTDFVKPPAVTVK